MTTTKMQAGGKSGAQLKKEGRAMKAKGKAMKAEGMKQKELGRSIKNNPIQSAVDKAILGEVMVRKNSIFKTGGMVNPNSTVNKQTVPGSKGVKSGVNTKVTAFKVAKGRVGGTSSAPKTAIPKAKMGMSMKGKKAC